VSSDARGSFGFWGVLLLIWGLFEKDKWESLILLVDRKGGILKKGGCTCEGKRKYGVYICFFLEKVWSCVFFVNFALDTEMLCCKLVNILMRDSRTREAERSKKVI